MQRKGKKFFPRLCKEQFAIDGKQSLLPQQDISFLAISKIWPAVTKMLPTTGPFRRNQLRLFSESKHDKEEGDKTEGMGREVKGKDSRFLLPFSPLHLQALPRQFCWLWKGRNVRWKHHRKHLLLVSSTYWIQLWKPFVRDKHTKAEHTKTASILTSTKLQGKQK